MAYFDTKTGSLEEAIKAAGSSELEEKLDPVNKAAAKKKFDDRKDKDIDNDGDAAKEKGEEVIQSEPAKKIVKFFQEQKEKGSNYVNKYLKENAPKTAEAIKK